MPWAGLEWTSLCEPCQGVQHCLSIKALLMSMSGDGDFGKVVGVMLQGGPRKTSYEKI